MENNSKILIIMPAYNESASIGNVISEVKKEAPHADILVVNDGSQDATSQIAKDLKVVVVDLLYNMGIGAAMQTGYRYAFLNNYEIAVQLDADGQHPPDQVKYLIPPIIEQKSDIVIGSRFLGKGEYNPSLARNIGIKVFSVVVSFLTGQSVTDTTSGFRAVNKDVIKFFAKNYPEDYPEVEAIVMLRKAGFNIMEVPVRMEARAGGVSSITPLRSLYYMVKVLLAVFVDMLKKVKR